MSTKQGDPQRRTPQHQAVFPHGPHSPSSPAAPFSQQWGWGQPWRMGTSGGQQRRGLILIRVKLGVLILQPLPRGVLDPPGAADGQTDRQSRAEQRAAMGVPPPQPPTHLRSCRYRCSAWRRVGLTAVGRVGGGDGGAPLGTPSWAWVEPGAASAQCREQRISESQSRGPHSSTAPSSPHAAPLLRLRPPPQPLPQCRAQTPTAPLPPHALRGPHVPPTGPTPSSDGAHLLPHRTARAAQLQQRPPLHPCAPSWLWGRRSAPFGPFPLSPRFHPPCRDTIGAGGAGMEALPAPRQRSRILTPSSGSSCCTERPSAARSARSASS